MPRKTNTDRSDRGRRGSTEKRTPRPKPKIDFTVDALDFKNTNLLRQFVTDQGRMNVDVLYRTEGLRVFSISVARQRRAGVSGEH